MGKAKYEVKGGNNVTERGGGVTTTCQSVAELPSAGFTLCKMIMVKYLPRECTLPLNIAGAPETIRAQYRKAPHPARKSHEVRYRRCWLRLTTTHCNLRGGTTQIEMHSLLTKFNHLNEVILRQTDFFPFSNISGALPGPGGVTTIDTWGATGEALYDFEHPIVLSMDTNVSCLLVPLKH